MSDGENLFSTRADQILNAFVKFHRSNPHVWVLFQKFALQATSSGRKAYSSRCIIHRVRWHTAIETRGEELKINDHYTPYYARLFHLAYPEHNGFFRNRKLLSENKVACNNDIQVFNCGEAGPEEWIKRRLEKLLTINKEPDK